MAVIERPGLPTPEVLTEILPEIISQFPLAEIHALGCAIGHPRFSDMGAPAAFDPVHIRPRDRRTGRSYPSRSAGSRRAMSLTATASSPPAPIPVRRLDDYVAALEKPPRKSSPIRRFAAATGYHRP